MLNQTQTTALVAAVTAAVACENGAGLPAELTTAQWADESGWGQHQPGNNCFGIKAASGESLTTTEYTRSQPNQPVIEAQTFEVFPDLAACFARHSALITTGKPYIPAWTQYGKDKNLSTFIERIAKSYATDPNYALKLKRILAMPEVANAIRDGRRPLVNLTAAPAPPAAAQKA